MSWSRRVAQFVAHVRARVSTTEDDRARSLLPAAARSLYDAMPVADRRHALDVLVALDRAGIDDRDVRIAALLHDAAKGHRVRLWHRVGGVLLARLAPGSLERLADPNPRSWRHPWFLVLHHADLSAELAARHGCPPRAVAFLRRDVPPADAQLLRTLTAADDAS